MPDCAGSVTLADARQAEREHVCTAFDELGPSRETGWDHGAKSDVVQGGKLRRDGDAEFAELMKQDPSKKKGGGFQHRLVQFQTRTEKRRHSLTLYPDDIDWIVEQEAYCDVIDGKIAWMTVLCGGYQPLVPVPTAPGRPETASRQLVI